MTIRNLAYIAADDLPNLRIFVYENSVGIELPSGEIFEVESYLDYNQVYDWMQEENALVEANPDLVLARRLQFQNALTCDRVVKGQRCGEFASHFVDLGPTNAMIAAGVSETRRWISYCPCHAPNTKRVVML